MTNTRTTYQREQCRTGCAPDTYVWSDPSFRSTPEIWKCAGCGREARWRRDRDGHLIFIDVAPPARDYPPDTARKVSRALKRTIWFAYPIHSHITQASRRRATEGLPARRLRLSWNLA